MTYTNLTDLTIITHEHEVIVIVPAQDVLLLQANLPKLNRQRLQQALPYTLEEQLIDDVSELHFATGEYQENNTYPVAVVAQQKMETWLNTLKSADISPTIMIPSSLALPAEKDHWYIAMHGTSAIVRTGSFTGFACDKNNLQTLLELTLSESAIKPNITNLSEQQFLENIPNWIAANPVINLLQGNYQAKRKVTQIKKTWLLASYLVAAWLGVALFSNIISSIILHYQVSSAETAINQIYKRNFPQATAVVSPKEQMAKKLNQVSTAANNNHFLTLLGFVSHLLSPTMGVHLHNLEFRDNQLNLTVSATTFDNLDALTNALTQQGLIVKQQNAAIADARVNANLLISEGTP